MLNNLTQVMWRLNAAKITDEQRDAAIKATSDLLVSIDIKRVDTLRQRLELPPECLGFVAEIYAAILAAPFGELREVLPLSTVHVVDGKRQCVAVKPTQSVTIKATPKVPFRPEKLLVSNAGTSAGAADWIVNDVRLDGQTVFLQSGDVPGDLFASNAVDSFIAWGECSKSMEIDVTYIGLNEEAGCPFFGSAVGSRVVPSSDKSEAAGKRA